MRKSSSQHDLRSQYSNGSLLSYPSQLPPCHVHRPIIRKRIPSYNDLMRTIDNRYASQPSFSRSSFALSDIWEEDETEIEICNILPTSLEYADSIERERRRSGLFAKKLKAFIASLRYKLQRRDA